MKIVQNIIEIPPKKIRIFNETWIKYEFFNCQKYTNLYL